MACGGFNDSTATKNPKFQMEISDERVAPGGDVWKSKIRIKSWDISVRDFEFLQQSFLAEKPARLHNVSSEKAYGDGMGLNELKYGPKSTATSIPASSRSSQKLTSRRSMI